MAGRPAIQCIGPSYHLADRKAAVQRAVNLYLRAIDGLGESKQLILTPAQGLVPLIDFGAPVRGIFATESREFVVAGNTLYETTSGTAAVLGSIAGTDAAEFEDGTDQLVIVNGPQGYVLRLDTNTLSEITDPDWRGSYSVAELNGLFIFVALDQPDQFFLSKIDDASDLDALDFSSSDAQPDSLVVVRVLKQEAYFFGTRSTEVWIFTGDSDFPLTRYNSTPIDVGIVGRGAVVRAADTLVFVGCTERGTGIVYAMEGHQPVRVSNAAVEEALQAQGVDLSQCTMWSQQTVGAEFVGINAPGLGTTWVLDMATRQWHERSDPLVDGAFVPYRVRSVASFGGQHHAIAGTKLYRMADKTPFVDGDPMTFERTWPHLLSPAFEEVTYRSLQLQCTTGTEIAGNITLEISNNGGFVFGPPLLRSLGAVGQWMQTVRWNWLGAALDRVFRLRWTGVHCALHQANVDAS